MGAVEEKQPGTAQKHRYLWLPVTVKRVPDFSCKLNRVAVQRNDGRFGITLSNVDCTERNLIFMAFAHCVVLEQLDAHHSPCFGPGAGWNCALFNVNSNLNTKQNGNFENYQSIVRWPAPTTRLSERCCQISRRALLRVLRF
jgi:hypothetical protein